jgi:hypothetical protein
MPHWGATQSAAIWRSTAGAVEREKKMNLSPAEEPIPLLAKRTLSLRAGLKNRFNIAYIISIETCWTFRDI